MNFLSESENDLVVIEEIFVKFENVSGAILSRSKKSKVMGLGLWKDRAVWPLHWLQTKPELKIFGFQITPVLCIRTHWTDAGQNALLLFTELLCLGPLDNWRHLLNVWRF